jgi:hypothetical protein
MPHVGSTLPLRGTQKLMPETNGGTLLNFSRSNMPSTTLSRFFHTAAQKLDLGLCGAMFIRPLVASGQGLGMAYLYRILISGALRSIDEIPEIFTAGS